MINKKNLW